MGRWQVFGLAASLFFLFRRIKKRQEKSLKTDVFRQIMVEHRRFELLTPTLPVLCATNCANAPSTSISIPWKAAFVNHELPILFLQKNGLYAACTCAVTSRDRKSIRGGNCEKDMTNGPLAVHILLFSLR